MTAAKAYKAIAKHPHTVVTIICVIIAVLSAYVPEAVGPANSGDFLRVIQPSRIKYVDDNPRTMWQGYGYTPEFAMDLGSGGGILGRAVYFLQTDFTTFDFPSSQIPAIKLSKFLNLAYNALTGKPLSTYNLFWLFMIHLAIFAVAIHLIIGYIFRRFGLKAFVFSSLVAVFVLSDQGYTMYFNSFYGEALQYVLTLLVIGLLLRIEERRSGGLVLYCIAVYLMATSKFAWIPVGILFALAPLGFLLSKDIGFSRKKLIAFCSVTVCALLAFYALLIPSWIDSDTTFTAVFDGVLRNSQTPEQDLEELGLDPGYAVLQGWQAYMDGYPIDISSEEFNEGFFGQVSKAKILAFYLKHPSRLLDVLRESARYARYIRAPYLTSVQNPEFWGDQAYRFSLWERARVAIAPLANFWFIAAVLALGAAAAIAKLRSIIKRKAGGLSVMHPILLLVLIASAAGSFIMPYISNGIADQAKQLFGFINLFDIIIFTLIGCVVYSVDFSKIVKAVRRK